MTDNQTNIRNDIPKRQMVRWYKPAQLLRTGLEVVVSTLFGRHADSRRLDALSGEPPLIDFRDARYLDEDGSFRFDYVADTGDGWNSTYAVAYALSHSRWAPTNHSPLRRGKVLIFGGDLVYPYPTRKTYDERLVTPFALAGQCHEDESLDVLAVPGNHDWYDSLVNFRKLFCCQRTTGFPQTRQTRSYFAARLPGNWWLLGVDIQLDGDVDEAQFRFFSDVVDKVEDNDLVILCIPEPVWYQRWESNDTSTGSALLEVLEERIGERLRLCVAGDLHHYQRHSSVDKRHLVTCGMGGAFLHPTHEMPTDPTEEFEHNRSFPDQETSRKLALWNLSFVTRNPLFGIVPAFVYLFASWQNGMFVGECVGGVCIDEIGALGLSRWKDAIYAGTHSAFISPLGMALYGLIFLGFVFFADKRSTVFRYTFGALHALAHIAAGFLIYWFAAYTTITLLGLAPKSISQYLLSGSIIFILGWIVGSIVLGVYLLMSLNVFGMHRNEAFSSLRIQDWKGFLRFRIDKEGNLSMRSIGFEKVPRQWETVQLKNDRKIPRPSNPANFVGQVIDQIEIRAPHSKTDPGGSL